MPTDCCESGITIRKDLRPGDLGYITYLHGKLYAEEYGFDATFEPYVAVPLSEFSVRKNNRECIWVVEKTGRVRGSIAIVEYSDTTAQLRWLILHPEIRGRGMGKKLVDEAVNFSRNMRYPSIFLWTVSGLKSAAAIYEKKGFCLTDTRKNVIWGRELTEERYELAL